MSLRMTTAVGDGRCLYNVNVHIVTSESDLRRAGSTHDDVNSLLKGEKKRIGAGFLGSLTHLVALSCHTEEGRFSHSYYAWILWV